MRPAGSEANAVPRPGKLPAAVILLGFTSLFTDVGSEMIFPLLPVFLAGLGAAPAFLGLVEGAANATAALLKLGTGAWSDRLAKKKPLVLSGYLLAALTRPLVAIASAPWHVLVVRITDRVGKGIRTSPRDALIAAAAPKDQSGRAFGFHQAMDHAGAVIGPLAATGLLALGWSLRDVFWIALLPGVLSVIAVALLKEPEPAAPVAKAGAKGALPANLKSYLAILAVFSLGNSSDAFLLLRAKEVGIAVPGIPALWALFHVVKLLASYFGGAWSDRLPRVWLICGGWAIYALAYLGFGLASEAWQVWALFVLYGCYYGFSEPIEKALIKDLAPAELRGRAYGAYYFLVGMAGIPAGLLTGFLWQTFSPLVALATGGALAGCSAAALFVWSRRNRPGAANVVMS